MRLFRQGHPCCVRCYFLPAPLAHTHFKFCFFLAGLELSQCVGTNSLGPAGPWRSGGPCKMKRVRTVFKPEQLERLEQEFLKQQYMVGTERVDLAATLHLTETQVRDVGAGLGNGSWGCSVLMSPLPWGDVPSARC